MVRRPPLDVHSILLHIKCHTVREILLYYVAAITEANYEVVDAVSAVDLHFPPISTIGLGRTMVSSDSRVPSPPARITAFIGLLRRQQRQYYSGRSLEWRKTRSSKGSETKAVSARFESEGFPRAHE
jgi:hypothetical protein